MLRRLTGKPDHPMADLKEARRLLAELSLGDLVDALEHVTHWTQSLAGTEGFTVDERIKRYLLLDEAAQPHQRRVARSFFAIVGIGPFQEHRLGNVLSACWSTLAEAYRSALEQVAAKVRGAKQAGPLLPLVVARGFRAYAQQLKWSLMRYQPPEAGLWHGLAMIYAFGEERGVLHSPVELYPTVASPVLPVQELLKALMLWLAAPDTLSPRKLEIAERLTAHLAGYFRLGRNEGATVVYYFNLERPGPPTRAGPTVQEKPHRRFISAGEAWPQLSRLAEKVARAGVPPEIDGGLSLEPSLVIDVLRHLERHWSPSPPVRREARHRSAVPLSVAIGFDQAVQVLQGLEAGLGDTVQSWTAENISSGGFSAQLPRRSAERLQVGTLLSIQPEGACQWGVAVVRRLSRGDRAQVGVEILAHTAALVSVQVESNPSLTTHAGGQAHPGILLGEGVSEGEVRLVLKGGLYAPGRRLLMSLGGQACLLVPIALERREDEFDVGRFRVMERGPETND